MAYSTCATVAALIPNLLNNAASFDNLPTTVVPGSTALVRFMSAGCSLIETRLVSLGYGVPVAAGNRLYDLLADAEASYAAYRAEQSRGSPRTGPGTRSRAEGFKQHFEDTLESLTTMDLTQAGAALGYAGAGWYVGGTSQAEKNLVESDGNRVDPRFFRDQFANIKAAS